MIFHGEVTVQRSHAALIRITSAALTPFLLLSLASCGEPAPEPDGLAVNETTITQDVTRETVPAPNEAAAGPEYHARKILETLSLEQRVGQTVMVPLPLTATPDVATVESFVRDSGAGSVLLLGNWQGGVDQLATITQTLQASAPAENKLLIATDQEGGSVQHLKGPGFDQMPSAFMQGQQTPAALEGMAATWGQQLARAGVNVDFAPVLDTVTIDRASNAPAGALYRDFGKDAAGNAESAGAFIRGMRSAGVMTAIKHYPGLGGVSGNTDFTAEGIVDQTTALGGEQESAFARALGADPGPGMVMMSLATYPAIDATNPAAFSRSLITDHLRGTLGFQGVVTSDSLSAAALSSIAPADLGVRFIEAGGDLICVGAPAYARAIYDGLLAQARESADLRAQIDAAALRVLTLKVDKGLAHTS